MKTEYVVSQHGRVEMAARDQSRNVLWRTVCGAERRAEPRLGLFSLKKFNHASGTPDILSEQLAILHGRNAEKFQPPFAQLAASFLEQPLEVCQVAVALGGDNHFAARFPHRLGYEVVSPLIIGSSVDKIYPEAEPGFQCVDALLL